MQRINEWEIYYLLSVDPYKFVENLATKDFFYNFISKDALRDNSSLVVSVRSDYNEGGFNNVSIILIYICITNIINDHLYDSLNSRHFYFKKPKSINTIKRFIFHCFIENYKPDSTEQIYSLSISLNDFYWNDTTCSKIQIKADTPTFYEHEICINNVDNNFFANVILMYQDFIDNIPMPTL